MRNLPHIAALSDDEVSLATTAYSQAVSSGDVPSSLVKIMKLVHKVVGALVSDKELALMVKATGYRIDDEDELGTTSSTSSSKAIMSIDQFLRLVRMLKSVHRAANARKTSFRASPLDPVPPHDSSPTAMASWARDVFRALTASESGTLPVAAVAAVGHALGIPPLVDEAATFDLDALLSIDDFLALVARATAADAGAVTTAIDDTVLGAYPPSDSARSHGHALGIPPLPTDRERERAGGGGGVDRKAMHAADAGVGMATGGGGGVGGAVTPPQGGGGGTGAGDSRRPSTGDDGGVGGGMGTSGSAGRAAAAPDSATARQRRLRSANASMDALLRDVGGAGGGQGAGGLGQLGVPSSSPYLQPPPSRGGGGVSGGGGGGAGGGGGGLTARAADESVGAVDSPPAERSGTSLQQQPSGRAHPPTTSSSAAAAAAAAHATGRGTRGARGCGAAGGVERPPAVVKALAELAAARSAAATRPAVAADVRAAFRPPFYSGGHRSGGPVAAVRPYAMRDARVVLEEEGRGGAAAQGGEDEEDEDGGGGDDDDEHDDEGGRVVGAVGGVGEDFEVDSTFGGGDGDGDHDGNGDGGGGADAAGDVSESRDRSRIRNPNRKGSRHVEVVETPSGHGGAPRDPLRASRAATPHDHAGASRASRTTTPHGAPSGAVSHRASSRGAGASTSAATSRRLWSAEPAPGITSKRRVLREQLAALARAQDLGDTGRPTAWAAELEATQGMRRREKARGAAAGGGGGRVRSQQKFALGMGGTNGTRGGGGGGGGATARGGGAGRAAVAAADPPYYVTLPPATKARPSVVGGSGGRGGESFVTHIADVD